MKVRVGLACLSLLISCWCLTASSASAASNGARPRRQSRRGTLNEYLTPPAAPPNLHGFRGPGLSRHPRQHHGGSQSPPGPPRLGPPSSSLPFRHGKLLSPPPTESPGYFSRLMGWLNPFGSSPTQQALSAQHPRPEHNYQGKNLNSGNFQPPPQKQSYGPPSASYGPPAPSYGPPTNSHGGYPSAKNLPHPPSPQGGQGYLPPQESKNCNPCNQIPWVPLYKGVNTIDSRYAAGSADILPSESSDFSQNPHEENGSPNIYHVPSLSHEVKTPDFGYGPPSIASSSPIVNSNNQASSSSSKLNNNNNYNQNLNYPQAEYRLPFTGPIPNPQLYPGAMPPLFKAKPFDSQPQGTDNAFQSPPFKEFYNQDTTAFGERGAEDDNSNVGSISSGPSLTQFSESSSLFSDSKNHYSQPLSDNGGFNPTIDHQPSPVHQSGAQDEGYVEELPPGAETISPILDDQFPTISLNENHSNDNGAANSDHRHTLHSSTDHETTAGTSEVTFGAVKTESVGQQNFHENERNTGSVQISTDGQHIIHFEQSPIIDLSLDGEEEPRKDSNDSSASSSTSNGALEDPPVILQNSDGTYGINATWSSEDSSKNNWHQNPEIGTNIATVTASTLMESTSEVGVTLKFGNNGDSSGGISSGSFVPSNHQDQYTEYSSESTLKTNIDQVKDSLQLRKENRTNRQKYDVEQSRRIQESRQEFAGRSERPETPRKQDKDPLSLYPGLTRFEDSKSYGYRLPDPPVGPTSEEPFLQALIKTYGSFKKDPTQKTESVQTENREAWINPRDIHPGAGFQPSSNQFQSPQSGSNLGEGKSRSNNRQQGAKKNKQVQIIIPYTSQYTPEPFRPLGESWSTKTASIKTQARKVPIFERNRDYLAQETRRVEDEVSHILQSLENPSRAKEISRSPDGSKANTSIDVLRLQKNIDNWTIQEYSRGTTASTTMPKFSRPYLSPSKKIPDEYLTTTEPVVTSTIPIDDERKEIGNILAGFSFNDLEHEGSASDHIDVSHVEVSSHLNEVSSVFPPIMESTTTTTTTKSVVSSTTEGNSWEQLPVSISSLNHERVYVVTPQTITMSPTTRGKKSNDKYLKNEAKKSGKKEPDLDHFESIERAYQVLPQAVNNLVVASTGPAGLSLWGIMEHDKYASSNNRSTTPETPILYAGHSKVSHTRQ